MAKVKKKIIDEFTDFSSKLLKYASYRKRQIGDQKRLPSAQSAELASLYKEISVSVGKFALLIKECTGLDTIHTSAGPQDVWNWAFSFSPNTIVINALDNCIQATNRTIGKLRDDINRGKRDPYTGEIAESEVAVKAEVDVSSWPAIFDAMQFHPNVVEASRSCFVAGNYREAILNAFIRLIDYVKEITGLDLDGDDLMNQVFAFNYDKEQRRITKYPIIRINELKNKSDRDEQQGFMFLCKGAAGGIRNPKAHRLIPQSNPLHTLEYLAFASLLIRRFEEGKVVKTSPPRKQWNLQRFLADTRERCKQEVVDTITKLYDFTKSNSDSISWGTGSYWGSFTFRKSGYGITASIFTVYSDSSLTINFGQMKGKEIKEEALESLRVELNRIPEVKIPRDAVNIGKWHDISVEPLMNTENLNKFQEAVLSLCKNIESGGDK